MRVLLHGLGNSPIRSRFISNHCENFIKDVEEHEILTFGYNEGVNIKIDIGDNLDKVFNRLPQGWEPDICLFWEVDWNLLPEDIQQAPCPTVALISDWDYDIHLSKCYVGHFDLVIVIADFEKEALKALGARKVGVFDRAWVLKEFINNSPKEMKDRKYDIVYTTFLNDSLHPDRSRWVLKLCELSDKYNVLIESHLPGYKDYMALLEDSKLVFSHHRFGSMSGRVLEAGAQGAVVIDTGSSIRKVLKQGDGYISVTLDDLSSKVEALLNDEEKLQKMSKQINRVVSEKFEARDRFNRLLEFIRSRLEDKRDYCLSKGIEDVENLINKASIYFYSFFRVSEGHFIVENCKRLLLLSIDKLEKAVALNPSARAKTNLAIVKSAYGFLFNLKEFVDSGAEECIQILKETIDLYPSYAMAYFNAGILFLRIGKLQDALEYMKRSLALFEDDDVDIDLWCFHNRDYDLFNDFLRKPLNDSLLLYFSGDDKNAIRDIRNLYRAFILYLVALIEEKNGRIYAVVDALRQSESLYPNSRLTLGMLAQRLAILGHKEEVLELYRRTIELMPVNIGLRIEYIKVLYMYNMDKELIKEVHVLLKIIKSVSFYRNRLTDLKRLVDSLARLEPNPICSHDIGSETILNDWLEKMYFYLRKDPKNINLILRTVEILSELGRMDKAFELVHDYSYRYRNNLINNEELSSLKELYNHMRENASKQSIFYTERLNKINECLFNVEETAIDSRLK